MFGRWKDGTMQAVSLRAAMLPLLTQIEPCPLNSNYLVDPVPQLAIRTVPSPLTPSTDDTWFVYEQAARNVSRVDRWLRAKVVGEHFYCYEHGARRLWGDREYLSFHPEFCRHGYAFSLWCGRAYSWLKWVKEIADGSLKQKLSIDMRMLRRQLLSSYHFAFNGIELLCEMDAQDDAPLFDAAWSSGCLERNFDAWTMLHDSGANTYRLRPCNVAFVARPLLPEPFCDHGEMMRDLWANRRRMSEMAEMRRASSHP
ncbi:hypothetical protein [Rhodanobacter sp. DHG33]|uniref:hypothetical protein n=1 Tax=Rhodanobacter sp. DHG33 TaxID=2775921 RepID=UPI00178706B0|nr:hypothetical protein [Rhodanobacter sp. DHG33]MBD8898552.1 hypothetical protein [Rhodanobacter sp. DHG33]